jgi:hypothetical protein
MPYFVTSAMATLPRDQAVDELLLSAPTGDWSDLGDYTENVKVWLPFPVADAASKLAEQFNHSTTIIVRNALVIHAYGRLAFDQLVMNGQLRAPRGYTHDVVRPKMLLVSELEAHRAGRLTDMARDDPKAHAHLVADDGNVSHRRPIVALRIAVPVRLKQDLLTLAGRAGRPLSEYCRDTLTTYYLGALWE